MPVSFSCPCGRRLAAGDELAGSKVACPRCGATLAVPEALDDEEVGLLPLDEPSAEPPPSEAIQTTPPNDELIGEVLPAGPNDLDELEVVDDEEVSQRERVRRREARDKEREGRRAEEQRKKRRRQRQREEDYEKLVEEGRYKVRGNRGYLGDINFGLAAGIAMLVVGIGVVFVTLMLARAAGGGIFIIPVGLLVAGAAAVFRGMNR